MRTLPFVISLLGFGILSAFGQNTHKVKSGEHLNMIAEKYGTTAKELQTFNGIKNANLLKVGQMLKIPGKEGSKQSTATQNTSNRPAFHSVAKGDTFFAIAKKYGVEPNELIAANSKINPNKLSIGQKLNIPGGKTAPTTGNAPAPKANAESSAQNQTSPPANTTKRPAYTKVVITKQISLGDFAKNFSISVAQVNDVNGWSYEPATIFDVGSEAYVFRP